MLPRSAILRTLSVFKRVSQLLPEVLRQISVTRVEPKFQVLLSKIPLSLSMALLLRVKLTLTRHTHPRGVVCLPPPSR